MAIVTDDVAGLYWVATAPWARGRGLGAACARHATAAGFDLGALLACLQASQQGAGMWRSLGFAEVTRYRRYLAPGARSG
jgi:ribosomal protein S18 acetylase RimI-like enzyme